MLAYPFNIFSIIIDYGAMIKMDFKEEKQTDTN